jgi:hypothetical protein
MAAHLVYHFTTFDISVVVGFVIMDSLNWLIITDWSLFIKFYNRLIFLGFEMYFCEKHKKIILGLNNIQVIQFFWTRLKRSSPIKVGLKDVGLNDRAWTSYTRFCKRAKWVHCRPLDPDEECRWFKDISSTSPYLASSSSRESSKTVKESAYN